MWPDPSWGSGYPGGSSPVRRTWWWWWGAGDQAHAVCMTECWAQKAKMIHLALRVPDMLGRSRRVLCLPVTFRLWYMWDVTFVWCTR